MMLRESVRQSDQDHDLKAVVSGPETGDTGIAHGALLLRFADALLAEDGDALAEVRQEMRRTLGDAAFVDAAGVAGFFDGIDRVADGTGTQVDEVYADMAGDLPDQLGIKEFPSARQA